MRGDKDLSPVCGYYVIASTVLAVLSTYLTISVLVLSEDIVIVNSMLIIRCYEVKCLPVKKCFMYNN